MNRDDKARATWTALAAAVLVATGCAGKADGPGELNPVDAGADRARPPGAAGAEAGFDATSGPEAASTQDAGDDGAGDATGTDAGQGADATASEDGAGGREAGGAEDSGSEAAGEGGAEVEAGLPVVVLGTDGSWQTSGGNASPVDPTCVPSTWAAPPPYAGWIWSSPCTSTDTESVTFSHPLGLGAFSSATLSIAADNYASVTINGQALPATCFLAPTATSPAIHAVACDFTTIADIDITGYLRPGDNEVSIEVDNLPDGAAEGWGNPAGLLAWIVVQ